MNFYLGQEYHDYKEKFKKIKEHIRSLRALKTGSNAETFRWLVDRTYNYVLEVEEEEKE